MIAYLADLLQISPETIDINAPFTDHGISSIDAVSVSGELETLLGQRLSPMLVYEHPSISLLSHYLANQGSAYKIPDSPEDHPHSSNDPIAIIGIACRFPGAGDKEAFWQLLRNGVDAITEIPKDRWDKEAFYNHDPSAPGKTISKWGGFLESIDQFDPFFFGISPMEANYMDPQQRLLLELAYEALDDAGKTKENIAGTDTGVFIGISINEYSQLQFANPSLLSSHSGTGNALSIAANRISYFFDLHGPSMSIDTACSSSLSAVHLACQSLKNRECSLALAGGVNLILSPAHSISFTKAGVLSPDGRCRSFDAGANGYVRGEGGGVIVLKPLSAAKADGDPIYAIIHGSAMKQDGRTNGLMAPSSEAQSAMLREAYLKAGIPPESIQYVETHGTGTIIGDAMEAKAIGNILGAGRVHTPCRIGSVKSNIGHLEAAAGIAGLIKVCLSLSHREIPPSLHYHSPNPNIPFEPLHLQVQDRLTPWPSEGRSALAGVSSFGFGGTNVHIVVGESPIDNKDPETSGKTQAVETGSFLLSFSAYSPEALLEYAGKLQHLLASDSTPVETICREAALRRSQFNYRFAAIGHDRQELHNSLLSYTQGTALHPYYVTDKNFSGHHKLAFVFQGQGGQWYGMGRDLLQQELVFRTTIEQIDEIIRELCSWSLLELLQTETEDPRLQEIDVIQPVIFAIQVALAAQWKSWGIAPDAVIGHSMGEVAAACIAGALNLQDAIRVICLRSRLMKGISGKGSMLLTALSPDQAREWLKGQEENLSIAVVNSPVTTVISGNTDAILKLMLSLEENNIYCKPVNVDIASHSPQMDPLRSDLLEALKGLKPQPESLPIYSTVTGLPISGSSLTGEYWMHNLRETVLFADTIGRMIDDGFTAFIEIGAHPILLGSIQQCRQSNHGPLLLLPSLRREEPGREVMSGTVATLYTSGFSIQWENFFRYHSKTIQLPPIPWNHQQYWIKERALLTEQKYPDRQNDSKDYHPLLGRLIKPASSSLTALWQNTLDTTQLPYLKDHRINGEIILPASAYIEMALTCAYMTGLNITHELCDLHFHERMSLSTGQNKWVQATLEKDKDGTYGFSIFSQHQPEEKWVLHATAKLVPQKTNGSFIAPRDGNPEITGQLYNKAFDAKAFYAQLEARGIQYGPGFRGVEHATQQGNEAFGSISLPQPLHAETRNYHIHPALLDACFQVMSAINGHSSINELYIPTACRHIKFHSSPGTSVRSHVTLLNDTGGEGNIQASIKLLDSNNQVLLEISGLELQRLVNKKRPTPIPKDTWLYEIAWKVRETPMDPIANQHEKRHWLLFSDSTGIGDELVKQIEMSGDICYQLPFNDLHNHTDPSDESKLGEWIEGKLKTIPAKIYGIVHLWSLSISPQLLDETDPTDSLYTPGCNSVVLLIRALEKFHFGLPRLWLVTSGAQPINSKDQVAVEQAPLWGLGKVISFELPDLNCTRIDLDPLSSISNSARLLFRQLSSDNQEDQVAFRSGVPYVARLLPFPPTSIADHINEPIREDKTYLITGGMGALGLATAQWMVRKGARHLVLLGRNDPTPDTKQAIQWMQEEGATIVIEKADVSHYAQMEQVFERIRENMPPLKGVIHAAGILDDGSLVNLDSDRMKKVMAPKVEGTWNLHQLSIDTPLDFFVMFSSVVSVLGSPGQGNYAAASAYPDAMAHYRRRKGLPAISINWGPWAEVGLAAEATERLQEQNASVQHLVKVISIKHGLELLGQLLTQPIAQITVLPFDMTNLLDLYPSAASMPFFSALGGSNSHIARLYSRPNLRQQYIAPHTAVEQKLAAIWRQTLHIDLVGIHDSFFELGGDSVLAAQILSIAQKTFGIRITPQEAFKAFTIEQLAKLIETSIIEKISSMSEQEAIEELQKIKNPG
nr:type I polyketide synthase [Flavihumibacter stibioxidans]